MTSRGRRSRVIDRGSISLPCWSTSTTRHTERLPRVRSFSRRSLVVTSRCTSYGSVSLAWRVWARYTARAAFDMFWRPARWLAWAARQAGALNVA
jgi:hypothetical protein